MGSCAKTASVKRVVVTSSMAAVAYNGRPRTPDVVVDETWFSDSELCTQTKVCVDTSHRNRYLHFIFMCFCSLVVNIC